VVDDDPGIVDTFADILSAAGAAVETASNVRQAEARLAAAEYDLALVDIKLPDGSGIDLIRRFKPRLPRTRFIIVSAYADGEPARAAREERLAEVMAKPVDPADLIALVQQSAPAPRA
jgi:two-component system response regulator PilR (NtrC family)